MAAGNTTDVDCLLAVLRSVDTTGDASAENGSPANGEGGGRMKTGDPEGGPTAAVDGGGNCTVVLKALVFAGIVTTVGLCVLDMAVNKCEFVLEDALLGFDAATVTDVAKGFDIS